jgi:hypothetical protein
MITFSHSRKGNPFATILCLGLHLVSVLTLLTFPAAKAHSYTEHFRPPEVRRSITRHTAIETTSEIDVVQDVALADARTKLLSPVESEAGLRPSPDANVVSRIPLPRRLLRLKLCVAAGGSDPLL